MAKSHSSSGKTAVVVVLALVTVLVVQAPARATGGTTIRVSLTSGGTQANGGSSSSDISADGRYVSFTSSASNLVPGDTNLEEDIFVRDNLTGAVERVTVHSDGTQSNGFSFAPDISADGNRVSFSSLASNLVDNDNNFSADVFVHDRQTRTTVRVNVAADGSEATHSGSYIPSSISGNGRYVSFSSPASNLVPNDNNNLDDVFVHDLDSRTTTRVSVASTVPPIPALEAIGVSARNSISFDGRYVAFDSLASNLVAGDTNLSFDVFVHDQVEATTTRVSVASDGSQATHGANGYEAGAVPAISGDGMTVAFRSDATNLVAGDRNGRTDIFVHHRPTASTTRVSVPSGGTREADASSGFGSGNLLVADLSHNGATIAFRSDATNLVEGDTNGVEDIFVHRRETVETARVSIASDGTQANSNSLVPAVTADGRYVAFSSWASNLVPGDTNGVGDVFVHDTRGAAKAPVVSVGDVAVHEGDAGTATGTFTVSLSAPSTASVTLAYSTTNGSAGPGDFTAKSGTLSFGAGTTTGIVKIPVAGDTADEADETFTLTLSSPTGAVLGDGIGVGTILDDDPPTIAGQRVAIGDVAIHEGDAGARSAMFAVSLSRASTSPVSVSFATSTGTATQTDFTATSGKLKFASGTTSLTVKVPISPDAAAEGSESFTVRLSNASGATITDATGVGTILDND